MDQMTTNGQEQHLVGAPGGPGAPRWVVPTSVASRTPSLHYKLPNILKPFGVTLDQKFRRRKAL